MKEYIEREAAIALSKEIVVPQASGVDYKHRCIDPQDIRELPAADVVEVRHGRWVLFDNAMSMWNVWVCSECGYRRKEGWMHTEAGKKPEAQYCENCMAKMDGGVNDGGD